MRDVFFAVFTLLLSSNALAQQWLQRDDIIVRAPSPREEECIAEQRFDRVGPPAKKLYAYKITRGYRTTFLENRVVGQPTFRVEDECHRMDSNAVLYRKEEKGYRKLWEKGYTDPAPFVYLSVYEHDSLLVMVYDFSDGGNAGYSHQEAYVIDKKWGVSKINEQPLDAWVKSQLRSGQHVASNLAKVHYDKKPVTYYGAVFNKDDHYRNPTGGSLTAELHIVQTGDDYSLKVEHASSTVEGN